jgi:hypothetical protein
VYATLIFWASKLLKFFKRPIKFIYSGLFWLYKCLSVDEDEIGHDSDDKMINKKKK